MVLTLYGSHGAGSAAVEMALRAAGLDYRLVRASSWEPDSDRDALLRLNPLGQIPTLQLEDGTVLTESAAILIHLGLEHPAAGLLPTAASARALHLRGLVYVAANCYAAVSVSDFPDQWTTATSTAAQDKVRQAARRQLHRRWEVFADSFGGVLDDAEAKPGALAFLAVVVSQWSGTRAHLLAQRPVFHALLLRLAQHPRIAPSLQ
ncbi:MAG: glutathione S-transferase [Burkholderiales bacterium]|nr:glutathione S-transferase [Burkholderiales bacterium]